MSRVTVRESLKKLDMMDVVSIEQGRGTFVKKYNLGNCMHPMFSLIDFGSFDIKTIYDARLYIEIGTCRLAAENRTEEDIKEMKFLTEQMRLVNGSGLEDSHVSIQEVDSRFHISIASASKNEILKAAMVNLEKISMACAERMNKSHAVMDDVIEDHMRIYQAILAQNPDSAEKAIVCHTERSKAFLM